MDYNKIYNDIISNAELCNREKGGDIYYERHHIIPKCIGGENSINNTVLLTAREHFICHKLLAEIYPNNRGINLAKWNMAHCDGRNHERKYNVSSREYDRMRKEFSESQTGEKHFLFGKFHSEEAKKKMSDSGTGRIVSEQTRIKLSEINSGKNNAMFGKFGKLNPMFGRRHTEEAKKMMSDAVKARKRNPHSEETKLKMSESAKLHVRSPEHIANIKKAREHQSEESRRKQSETVRNSPILTCPNCGKESRSKSNMKRYHFDNCRRLITPT